MVSSVKCGYSGRRCWINIGIRNIRRQFHDFTLPGSLPSQSFFPALLFASLKGYLVPHRLPLSPTALASLSAFLITRPLSSSEAPFLRTEMASRCHVVFFRWIKGSPRTHLGAAGSTGMSPIVLCLALPVSENCLGCQPERPPPPLSPAEDSLPNTRRGQTLLLARACPLLTASWEGSFLKAFTLFFYNLDSA